MAGRSRWGNLVVVYFSSAFNWVLKHKFHIHLCHVSDDFLFIFPCVSENPLAMSVFEMWDPS